MLQYPNLNPVAISFWKITIHWYAIMYLIGFAAAWFLARVHVNRRNLPFTKDDVADLLFYCAVGVILGGRLGSIIFYNFTEFLARPMMLLNGGMSFHGGFIGVIVAIFLFARSRKYEFFQVADMVAPVTAIGLGLGRVGNFINGELWGRVTDVPWGMVFPFARAGNLPRHPSQLYQVFLEGILLFLIIWIYSGKPRPTMAVSGMFLLCYGVFRFGVEFFREPDGNLGFVAFEWMTRGQQLCIPMILLGSFLIWKGYNRAKANPTATS